jgi:DNA-binding CsgD family transcriptional regulator/PAS domain-containing protein
MMRRALSPEELSDFIGAIYDCSLDPIRWAATFERITARLELHNSALAIQSMPTGDLMLVETTGMSPDYVARLFDYAADVAEIFNGLDYMINMPIGEPVTFSQIGDPRHWETSRYMQEWVIPQGIVDCAVINIARDTTTYSTLSLGRHGSAGLIGSFEVEAIRLLAPHLRRAVLISRVLDARSMVAASFASALDTLANAVVLVDRNLRIVHANRAGGSILSVADPLSAVGGQLRVRNPIAQGALEKAVREGEDDEASLGGRGISIPAPRGDGGPSVLHVLPLRYGSLRPGLVPSATAAIFVAPSGRLTLGESVAAPLFDLSPAEARVFAQMARGVTVAEASRTLGVATSTVRFHLLSIFEKTGAQRQADLIRLAESLSGLA